MLQWTENKVAVMTEDRNCILRGRDKYNLKLYLVGESSKQKIKMFRGVKSAENQISSRNVLISMSDKVIEKYNLKTHKYNEDLLGKLVGIKVRCTYEIQN